MFDDIIEWLQASLSGLGTYTYSRGMWQDAPSIANAFIVSVSHSGGVPPDVDDRRARFRVIILGPRQGRAHVVAVETAINALASAALGDTRPCSAASLRAMGEPVGPGYTEEDRPWYSIDLEVLF